MNHYLVPEIILNNVAQDRFAGQFQAVCLFVDLSGFTSLTTRLMQHGVEGAEVIAEVLSTVFEPLIEIVYQQGGFVAAFAGDAFTAIFPTQADNAYRRATLAAWQISQAVADNPSQTTRLGRFNFAIKVSMADGLVEWGVWQAAPAEWGQATTTSEQNAVYFFVGEALAHCLKVDQFTSPGAVVMTEAVANQLPNAAVIVEPLAPYWRLRSVTPALNQAIPVLALPVTDGPYPAVATFFPQDFLHRQITGELRQVATVFVNLQRLPVGEQATLFQQTLFRLLAQYGGYLGLMGYIGNQDTGCTLVLFWGAPTSYENNLRNALQFVLELRDTAALALRASVVFNRVYAGFVGSERRKAYTCYGTYVNLAARQMMMANWGEVWLDEETARLVQAEFRLSEQGWYLLKGFAEKKLAFLLEDHREDPPHSFHRRSPMVGRQREWAQLWQAVQPIFYGKFGGVSVIVGEAGIGKSRLVYEFQNQMQIYRELYRLDPLQTAFYSPLTAVWYTCRTDEILRQPLNPFCYWLRCYFQQSAVADKTLNKQRFDQRLDELIAAVPDQALADELERTRSLLAVLIGLYWENSLYQQLEPQLRLANTLDALKTFIKAESLRQPVILYLEDAQWLDAQSKLFLEKLTRHVENFPFMLIITTRPLAAGEQDKTTAPGDWALAEIPQTTIHLTPLAKDDLYLLAAHQLHGAVTAGLVDLLNRQAKGNPFFAEQILLYWQENKLLLQDTQGWRLQRTDKALSNGGGSPLSASVRTILTAQLDRLPQPVKEVVQTAAVLGAEFDSQVLAQMLPPNTTLATQLAIAEQANIWSAQGSSRYLFRHALLRDDAYDMQLRTRLRKLHHSAAEAIQQIYMANLAYYYPDLVYHYQQSEDRGQERYYAELAGEQAAERYANQDAVDYFSRALDLTESHNLAQRYTLLLKREAVYNLIGQRQEQWQDLQMLNALAETMQDKPAQLEVRLRQIYYERLIGNYETALILVQQAIELATRLHAPLQKARAYHAWGRIGSQQGQTKTALPKLVRALAIARKSASRPDEADSLYDIGHIYHARGRHTVAFTHYSQAYALYRTLGHQRGEINCLLMFGVIANEQGDYTAAHQHYAKTIARCQEIGWRHTEAVSLTNLGNNYFDFGDYKMAYTYHQRALALCQEIGDQEGEAISLDTIGLIWQHRGNAKLARTHFEQALQIQRQMGDLRSEGFTLTHLGYALYALGELKAATDALENAYHLRHELSEESHLIDDLAGLALVAFTQKDLKRAMAYVERILGWLQANGSTGVEFPILVYLICHQVLNAVAQIEPTLQQKAIATLQDGYGLLLQRAAKIQDAALQRKFLENVWFNREIIARRKQANAAIKPMYRHFSRFRFFTESPEKLF